MKRALTAVMTFFLLSSSLFADEQTQPYAESRVSARLNLSIKQDTDVVHFIKNNIDPNVVTKIYVLKHADPYELRAYLMKMVHSRKVNISDTGIQAIQYNDGTSMLMVSAENYRFDDHYNGESIDKVIETLDKPGILSRANCARWFPAVFRS